jgi:1-acyl-sn-glycerol-3-phosphate acyltransferase
MKIVRFFRIVGYTLSMYIVTHLIVFFYLFPVGSFRIIHNPGKGHIVKKYFIGILFAIIGKRLRVIGQDNLEPGKQYLIVSNYPGSYAGFALMNMFPEASILVHAFFSKVPLVGLLLRSTGAIFVQQKKFGRTKRSIDEILKFIENRSIIILPEGGRSPDGVIHKFRRGFIYIVRHSSLDLLPITLSGFYTLKPKNRLYLDPESELECLIHKPIRHSDIESMNDDRLLNLTFNTIQKDYKP